MQEPELALFALVIGHLLGDFVFQTQRDIARKKEHEWSAYASHAAIHYATAIFCLAALADVPMLSGRPYVAVLLIVTLHTVVDRGKCFAPAAFETAHSLALFVVDQIVHLGVLTVVGWTILLDRTFGSLIEAATPRIGETTLALIATYLAVVVGGGYLIRVALDPFARKLVVEGGGEQLAHAGLYIGWLERFLILTAAIAGSFTSVGLIVAAKSIFRFPEMKDRPFAEYFLIGTLMSVTLAVLGAMFLSLVGR